MNKKVSAKNRVVIKLSGSIFKQNTEAQTIHKYAKMILTLTYKVQPVVITGGGSVARYFINIARNLGSNESNLDIMGIEVSRLNARLLIAALGKQAYSRVPKNLEEVAMATDSGKIVVAGGLHPGQSTNATSALIAETVEASRFVNATDVNGIYDSDPNTNTAAKLLKQITVRECMEILRTESSMAGTYDLMDIVALKVIERSKIPTRVIRSDVKNIKMAVGNTRSIGTEILVVKK